MSQAESIVITSRAGSSQPRLQVRQFTPVELAYIRMITRLAAARPTRIVGAFADRVDVEDRAEHLASVMAALVEYANTVVTDTAELVPVGAIDRKYITSCLTDLAGEVVVGIRRAADE